MDNEDFNEEVDQMIEWCDDLDYDKYMDEWQVLATSNKIEPSNQVTMLSGGLGEISVGLERNVTQVGVDYFNA